MCGIIFDAFGLIAIAMLFNDGETPPLGLALGSSAILAFGSFAIALGLAMVHPLLPLLVILILPVAAALVLHIMLDVTIGKAALGGLIFLVYKIVWTVGLQMMLGG